MSDGGSPIVGRLSQYTDRTDLSSVFMKQRRMSSEDVAKKYDELGWRLGKARREGWYEEDPGWADIDRILIELGHMKETDR